MARHTEKAILTVFEEMLEEMPFDKITVLELTKRCDISPNTFYYHYADIYELLEYWFNAKTKDFLASRPKGEGWECTLKAIFVTFTEHPNLVYNIYESLSRENLERYVFSSAEGAFLNLAREKTMGTSIDEETLTTISDICCYAIIGLFLKFLWSRMTMNIDKSINQISRVINAAIELYMANALMGINIFE